MIEGFYRLLQHVLSALLAVMTMIIFAQVVARYGFGAPLVWSEEAARYLQIWLVLLGAVVLFRRDEHIAIDLVHRNLPPLGQKIATLAAGIVMAAMFAVCFYWAMVMVTGARPQYSPALQLPMAVIYWGAPVLFGLLALEALRLTWRAAVDRPGEGIHDRPIDPSEAAIDESAAEALRPPSTRRD